MQNWHSANERPHSWRLNQIMDSMGLNGPQGLVRFYLALIRFWSHDLGHVIAHLPVFAGMFDYDCC